jgi:hypothetical protein
MATIHVVVFTRDILKITYSVDEVDCQQNCQGCGLLRDQAKGVPGTVKHVQGAVDYFGGGANHGCLGINTRGEPVGEIEQRPVQEVLCGGVVQAVLGRGHYVGGALQGLSVGGVYEELDKVLSGGQAGTAPLDEVVGGQGVTDQSDQLEQLEAWVKTYLLAREVKVVVDESTMGLVVAMQVQGFTNNMVVRERIST